ncbi:MAG: SagB/ThcOx family dehydrogenase [Desulfobacteraceae bacterium]|nr:SagB/ThcOx family dehydrogenase [Desulfobacteraceae bacterium]
METSADRTFRLPEPQHESQTSLEQAFLQRRSERSYADAPLSMKEISQLLWAAQGITSPRGFRTAPSAGALYPLEIFVAAGDVEGLSDGIYRYLPETHSLKCEVSGDKREELSAAALHQSAVRQAPAVFVFTAVFERTTGKYGKRGNRYVFMEAGHAAQNLCLQTVSLDLAAVTIGAFDDSRVSRILELNSDTRPLYLLPVGKPK